MKVTGREYDFTCKKCACMMDIYVNDCNKTLEVDPHESYCDECMVKIAGHPNFEYVTVMKPDKRYY